MMKPLTAEDLGLGVARQPSPLAQNGTAHLPFEDASLFLSDPVDVQAFHA